MDCAISLFGRGGEEGRRLKDQTAALACCLKMVEQLNAVDELSDAKNANDIGSREYLEKVKRIWHVGVARRGHICRPHPYREGVRKLVRPSSDRRI